MIQIKQPDYFHTTWKHPTPTDNTDSSFFNLCQRVGIAALPLIGLHKSLHFPLSLAVSGLRTISSISSLYAIMEKGSWSDIFQQTAASVASVAVLGGTFFAHPLGMLVSTAQDTLTELARLTNLLSQGRLWDAAESSAHLINNSLYLSLFVCGSVELMIASLAIQTLMGLYQSQKEFKKGRWIEGTAHLLVATARGLQLQNLTNLKFKRALFQEAHHNKKKHEQAYEEKRNAILKYARYPGSPIRHAAAAGDILALEKISYNIYDKEAFLSPAVQGAVQGGHLQLAESLLARSRAPQQILNNTIICAIKEGSTKNSLKYLLDKGAQLPDNAARLAWNAENFDECGYILELTQPGKTLKDFMKENGLSMSDFYD